MIPRLTSTKQNIWRKVNEIIDAVNILIQRNPDIEMNRMLRRVPMRPATEGIHIAYCKIAPSTGSTLVCFLDTDTTGTEITVYFTLLGGITNLSDGHLSLVDGTPVPVIYRGSQWWCIIPIEGTEDCS